MDKILDLVKTSKTFDVFYLEVGKLRGLTQETVNQFFDEHSHLAIKEASLDFYNKHK